MLSRFGGSSLKIWRFTQILRTAQTQSVPSLLCLRTSSSNYATSTIDQNVTKTKKLKTVISELKARIENKSRLTSNDLQILLTNLKTEKVDSDEALEILRCCSFARIEQNQSKIVNNIWDELKKHENQFQIQHYHCMLQFAKDKADAQRAQQLFDEMVNAAIKPDILSYHYLLEAYCQSGNIDKAIEVLGLMDNENLYINERSFNNLVQCHIICGNLDAANETITNLKEAGYKLNHFTLEALLRYHAGNGDLENIEKTVELFKKENVELLNRDILKVMCDLAANGHSETVDSLIPHLKPNVEMRRSLQNAITLFVENKQSPIVPKVLQSVDGNVHGKIKFLIQEMVRLSTPEPEFNETITNIEAMGITIETHFDLFKPALEGPWEDFIRKLLTHMKSRSIEVSENVFEKLFQLVAKKGSTEILNIVNLMCSEFNIQPQITFVRDAILPGLNAKQNPALAFAKLQSTKIRSRNVVIAMANNILNNGDIKTAYDFARARADRCFYGIELIKRPLLTAFATNGDISSFVSFVRLILDSFSVMNSYYKDKTYNQVEIREKQREFVDEMLFSAVSTRRAATQEVTQLLRSFIDEGLSISTKQTEKIQKYLAIDSETEIGRLLKQLSSEELKLKPAEVKKPVRNAMRQLSSSEVQDIMKDKETQGQTTASDKRNLLLSYAREKKLAKVDELLANNEFKLISGDYALLIEMYASRGNVEKALKMLNEIYSKDPSFKLDQLKVAMLVIQMIEKNYKFSDIEAILQAHRPDVPLERSTLLERLLDRLADNGHPKLVEQLFKALIENHYIKPTAETTGPLILSNLKSGANAEAVAKYDHVVQTYGVLSMTMVLFIELIRDNEIDLLQQAFDVCERMNGESSSLCRLAFAFVACGHDRQAKAILESDRAKNMSHYIARECKQYVKHDRINPAKTLLKATKGLYCDRHIIYQTVLDIYKRRNKAQDALDLWCEYSTEDGILPRQHFKNVLITLLKRNNMEIPDELKVSDGQSNIEHPEKRLDQDA